MRDLFDKMKTNYIQARQKSCLLDSYSDSQCTDIRPFVVGFPTTMTSADSRI